jgi:excisionase family DNA binding protein
MLSIEKAAGLLGLHYMTVYRYIRTGRLAAEYRDGRWQILSEDVEALLPPGRADRRRAAQAGGARKSARSLEGAAGRMLDRLLAGDGPGAWLIVEQALLTAAPSDVYLLVLAPSLRTIGEHWESGRISVGEEHRATAMALGIVGRLGPLFGRPGRRRRTSVLLAGAEGDPHVIPLMMVGDLLRSGGLNVVQLGADVPVDTVVAMAAASEPSVVGLSASTDPTVASAARGISELHRQLAGVPVMLGGPAVPSATVAERAGADGWAGDGASAVDLALRLAERGREDRP